MPRREMELLPGHGWCNEQGGVGRGVWCQTEYAVTRPAAILLAAVLVASACSATTLETPGPSEPSSTPQPSSVATATPLQSARATIQPSGTPTPTSPPQSAPPSLLLTPGPTMPAASDVAAELNTSGALTACLAVMGAPAAGLDEGGQLVGYNVSFAEELSRRLHLRLEIRSPLFDDLITTVEAHDCDVSVSSQNITAAREQRVAFVAYTKSIQPVLVAAGNPTGIATLDDLCGKQVSATTRHHARRSRQRRRRLRGAGPRRSVRCQGPASDRPTDVRHRG